MRVDASGPQMLRPKYASAIGYLCASLLRRLLARLNTSLAPSMGHARASTT
jgi:hypothetical protein